MPGTVGVARCGAGMGGLRDSQRPDHLPISAAVWDVAQQYDPSGPTVAAAIYEALHQLEAEVLDLCRELRAD